MSDLSLFEDLGATPVTPQATGFEDIGATPVSQGPTIPAEGFEDLGATQSAPQIDEFKDLGATLSAPVPSLSTSPQVGPLLPGQQQAREKLFGLAMQEPGSPTALVQTPPNPAIQMAQNQIQTSQMARPDSPGALIQQGPVVEPEKTDIQKLGEEYPFTMQVMAGMGDVLGPTLGPELKAASGEIQSLSPKGMAQSLTRMGASAATAAPLLIGLDKAVGAIGMGALAQSMATWGIYNTAMATAEGKGFLDTLDEGAKGGISGALFHGIDKFMPKSPIGVISGAIAKGGAMVGVQDIVEGKMPTAHELAANAILMLGFDSPKLLTALKTKAMEKDVAATKEIGSIIEQALKEAQNTIETNPEGVKAAQGAARAVFEMPRNPIEYQRQLKVLNQFPELKNGVKPGEIPINPADARNTIDYANRLKAVKEFPELGKPMANAEQSSPFIPTSDKIPNAISPERVNIGVSRGVETPNQEPPITTPGGVAGVGDIPEPTQGKKIRRFFKTLMGSKRNPPEGKKALLEAGTADRSIMEYDPTTNEGRRSLAEEAVKANPDEVYRAFMAGEIVAGERTPIGTALADRFFREGNIEAAQKVMALTAKSATTWGQDVQYLSTWADKSLVGIQRQAAEAFARFGREVPKSLSERITKRVMEIESKAKATKPRSIKDILSDYKQAGYDIGAIGKIELTKAQLEARARLLQDRDMFVKMAAEKGMAVEALLKQVGIDDKSIAIMMRMKATPPSAAVLSGGAVSEHDKAIMSVLQEVSDQLPLKLREYVDAYRYTNMLSNPRSHFRNIYWNALQTLVSHPLDLVTRATVNVAGVPFGRERGTTFRDPARYLKGIFGAYREAVQGAAEAFKQDISNKFMDQPVKTQIEALRRNKMPGIMKLIPRSMESADKFFRVLIMSGEMNRLMAKGMSQEEALKRAGTTADNLLLRSQTDPKNKTGQGKLLSAIDQGYQVVMSAGNIGYGVGRTIKHFVPFIQVPTNWLKRSLEREAIFGTLSLAGRIDKKEQMVRIMQGSVIEGLGAMAAAYGKTTWSAPTASDDKAVFYAAGKRPYSISIPIPGKGDVTIPFAYLGPWAFAAALPAALDHVWRTQKNVDTMEWYKKVGQTASTLAEFYSSQSFLSGVGDWVDLMRGEGTKSTMGNIMRTGNQYIPLQGLEKYINDFFIDPIIRKPEGLLQQGTKDIIGLSRQSTPKFDPKGAIERRQMFNAFLPYDVAFRGYGSKEAEYYKAFEKINRINQVRAVFEDLQQDARWTSNQRTREVKELISVMQDPEDRINAIREAFAIGTITKKESKDMIAIEKIRRKGYTEDESKLKEQPRRVRAMYIDDQLKGKSLKEQTEMRGRWRKMRILDHRTRVELRKLKEETK